MENIKFTQEQKEVPKYGANVELRNLWVRHSQKASGEVFATEGSGISKSSISESGHTRANEFGSDIEDKKSYVKSYVSKVDRTGETGESILKGYLEENEVKVFNERYRKELNAAPGNEEWLDLYNKKFSENKNHLLKERGYQPEDFSSLSPDEQEEIAETAEEPIMREWLDNPDSELAMAYNKDDAAALFAPLFNDHTLRIVEKLKSGSSVDLLHNTHKTATEAFLVSGVLIDETGKSVNTLEEIGGSLQILGNWESVVKTDENGDKSIVVRVGSKEYGLNTDKLNELLSLNS